MFNKKICFKIYRLGNELNNGGLLRLNSFYTMYIVQYKLKSDFRLSPTPFCSELYSNLIPKFLLNFSTRYSILILGFTERHFIHMELLTCSATNLNILASQLHSKYPSFDNFCLPTNLWLGNFKCSAQLQFIRLSLYEYVL